MTHGTLAAYTSGCRCGPCKREMSAYQSRRRFGAEGRAANVDHGMLSDLLHELFPDGLTDDCPAARDRARCVS